MKTFKKGDKVLLDTEATINDGENWGSLDPNTVYTVEFVDASKCLHLEGSAGFGWFADRFKLVDPVESAITDQIAVLRNLAEENFKRESFAASAALFRAAFDLIDTLNLNS